VIFGGSGKINGYGVGQQDERDLHSLPDVRQRHAFKTASVSDACVWP